MKRSIVFVVILVCCSVICGPMAVSLAGNGKEITVVGVIETSKHIDYVVADNGKYKYRIIGQDCSKLIGKKLKVTGKLAEGHGEKALTVTYMEFVKN